MEIAYFLFLPLLVLACVAKDHPSVYRMKATYNYRYVLIECYSKPDKAEDIRAVGKQIKD